MSSIEGGRSICGPQDQGVGCGDVHGCRIGKSEENTAKHGPLRSELKKQYPGHDIEQFNITLDVLGGRSRDLDLTMRKLFGSRGCVVLRRMQKATISSTLSIVRSFKATVT